MQVKDVSYTTAEKIELALESSIQFACVGQKIAARYMFGYWLIVGKGLAAVTRSANKAAMALSLAHGHDAEMAMHKAGIQRILPGTNTLEVAFTLLERICMDASDFVVTYESWRSRFRKFPGYISMRQPGDGGYLIAQEDAEGQGDFRLFLDEGEGECPEPFGPRVKYEGRQVSALIRLALPYIGVCESCLHNSPCGGCYCDEG